MAEHLVVPQVCRSCDLKSKKIFFLHEIDFVRSDWVREKRIPSYRSDDRPFHSGKIFALIESLGAYGTPTDHRCSLEPAFQFSPSDSSIGEEPCSFWSLHYLYLRREDASRSPTFCPWEQSLPSQYRCWARVCACERPCQPNWASWSRIIVPYIQGIQMQRGRKVDWDLFVRLMVVSHSGKDAWLTVTMKRLSERRTLFCNRQPEFLGDCAWRVLTAENGIAYIRITCHWLLLINIK